MHGLRAIGIGEVLDTVGLGSVFDVFLLHLADGCFDRDELRQAIGPRRFGVALELAQCLRQLTLRQLMKGLTPDQLRELERRDALWLKQMRSARNVPSKNDQVKSQTRIDAAGLKQVLETVGGSPDNANR
jgi:hypothetical protein